MTKLSPELKGKIADLYLKNRARLEQLDPAAMQSFASELLELIGREKARRQSYHDLEVLEDSVKHLKDDSARLRSFKPGTDDYDFALDDCRNLVNSTRKWLKLEGLI